MIFPFSSPAVDLTILTEDPSHLNYLYNGKLVGHLADIVKEIREGLDRVKKFRSYPGLEPIVCYLKIKIRYCSVSL